MPVTEESRHRLHQALDDTIGPEEATTLMEHLPPVGWADVATKQDLAHLREHIDRRFAREREHVDHRFEMIDHRFDAERAHVDGRFALVDERVRSIDQRFEDVDRRFDGIDRRLDEMVRRFDSIANQLNHQFWQFLTVIIAFGAIVIGVLRFT